MWHYPPVIVFVLVFAVGETRKEIGICIVHGDTGDADALTVMSCSNTLDVREQMGVSVVVIPAPYL